ncbi:MAG: hypothetical protein GY788_19160 [bacterium]|nr:hypothetical protein [bacterium]
MLIGILIINCSLFRYYDLKKTIALSSILHLNYTLLAILSLNSCGIFSGVLISISHGFPSISLSLIIGLPLNKTYSRLLDTLFLINSVLRLLLLFLILANNSFPSSIN